MNVLITRVFQLLASILSLRTPVGFVPSSQAMHTSFYEWQKSHIGYQVQTRGPKPRLTN